MILFGFIESWRFVGFYEIVLSIFNVVLGVKRVKWLEWKLSVDIWIENGFKK